MFRMPSGNIECTMTTQLVSCAVLTADWSPTGDTCAENEGRYVTFTGDVPSATCAVVQLPVGDERLRTLPYEQELNRGPFTCQSAEDGLTCFTSAHGFKVSVQSFQAR